MTKFTLKYIYLIAVLLITIALYLWPDFHPDKVLGRTHFWWMDMIVHGGYFFATTVALLLAQLNYKPVYIGFLFFLLSMLLELLQYFSYNRSVDIVDVGCNFLGIALAVGVYLLATKKR
jgi:VanZ family protein